MVPRVLRCGYRFSESRDEARDLVSSSAEAWWLPLARKSSMLDTQIV